MQCFINLRREREPFSLALIILGLIDHCFVKEYTSLYSVKE